MEKNTLEVRNLTTRFSTSRGETFPVNDVSILVPERSIVGIVGESGSGKSMTSRSIMRLIPSPGKIVRGEVLLAGRDLLRLSERDISNVRGEEISMIFQEPMTSLNPVMKAGRQVQEAILLHHRISPKEAKAEVLSIFRKVGISDPEKRYDAYPHELSGGLRQRVLIAMAMICRPKLLIADEPTTALDVTVAAQILDLMRKLRDETGTGIILISHSLGTVAQICDYVYVMYGGRVVEQADVVELFDHPKHPYTIGLLRSVESLLKKSARLETISGTVPALADLPKGCGFSTRCAFFCEDCAARVPELTDIGGGHYVRCPRFKGADA